MNAPFNILVVDDHVDSAAVLARLLAHMMPDSHVVTANTFHEAVKAATAVHFDLLLCDIGLPDGDGRELLQEIRAMYPLRAISISAYAMKADLQSNRAAGFDDCVTKPCSVDTLMDAIRRLPPQISDSPNDSRPST
jgi:two-component system CheB/CheR fusion protein